MALTAYPTRVILVWASLLAGSAAVSTRQSAYSTSPTATSMRMAVPYVA